MKRWPFGRRLPGVDVIVNKEMALTRKMFLKTLPRALDTDDYEVAGDIVICEDGPRRFKITFVEQENVKLGGFSIPKASVTLELTGYKEDEAYAAVERFQRYFHRGGG